MDITRRDALKWGGAAAAAALAGISAAPAAAQTPKRGGVFKIRGEDPVSGLDPQLVVNHHRIATNLSFTHSRLVKVKAGSQVKPGTMPIEGDLAESWTQPNATTFVFTEMIKLQRKTYDVAKRREIVYDIQRYAAEQVYYHYGPSVNTVAAWEPHVKNFGPNIGHDYGGRMMVAWLDK
jgi:ABC-type transport system substrate-binding protein